MNIAKEKRAIEYLKAFEPETEPYHLCYSGGKDSDVIRILASLAGVKHDIVNNHTTVDAPETVRRRLDVYHAETEVLKDFYAKLGKLRLVEGNQTIEGASEDILAVIGAKV